MYGPSYQPFFHTPFDKEVYRRRKINYHLSLVDYYSKQDIKDYEGTCIPFTEWEYIEHEEKECELHEYYDKKRCVICGKNQELKPIHVVLPPELVSKILRLHTSLLFTSRSVCKAVRECSLPCIYEYELLECFALFPEQPDDTVYVVTEGSYVVTEGSYEYISISYVGNIDVCRAIVEYKHQSYEDDKEGTASINNFYLGLSTDYIWNFPKHFDKTEVFDIYTIEKGLRYTIETKYGCKVDEEKLNSILQATLEKYTERYKLYPLCNALAKDPKFLDNIQDIREYLQQVEKPFYSHLPSKHLLPHIIK